MPTVTIYVEYRREPAQFVSVQRLTRHLPNLHPNQPGLHNKFPEVIFTRRYAVEWYLHCDLHRSVNMSFSVQGVNNKSKDTV